MANNEFGDYIRREREAKKLNMSELARRTGITPQYVRDIEAGIRVPGEDKIEKLIEVLNLDEYETFKLADKIPIWALEAAKREYFASGGKK